MSMDEQTRWDIGLVHGDSIPGIYTEAEFDEVIKRSEKSGNATTEELNDFFHKWGL